MTLNRVVQSGFLFYARPSADPEILTGWARPGSARHIEPRRIPRPRIPPSEVVRCAADRTADPVPISCIPLCSLTRSTVPGNLPAMRGTSNTGAFLAPASGHPKSYDAQQMALRTRSQSLVPAVKPDTIHPAAPLTSASRCPKSTDASQISSRKQSPSPPSRCPSLARATQSTKLWTRHRSLVRDSYCACQRADRARPKS